MNTFRPTGGKDRHLKVRTSKGTRDRRIRLSVSAAIQLYDIQDRLGYSQPSMAVEWLIKKSQQAINELAPLPSIVVDGVISRESHRDVMSAAISTELPPCNIDELPRPNSAVETHSNTESFQKLDKSDSGFLKSNSHTIQQRYNLEAQTNIMGEDQCVHARLLEQEFSGNSLSCTMSEARGKRQNDRSTLKTDSRTIAMARERGRSAREGAKARSSLKAPVRKDTIVSSRSFPAGRIISQSSPAENVQLSCSTPAQTELLNQRSHSLLQGRAENTWNPISSHQFLNAQVGPTNNLVATQLFQSRFMSDISQDLQQKEQISQLTISSCPWINPLHFPLHSSPTATLTPPQKTDEFFIKGSLHHQKALLSSSSSHEPVYALTAPFSVSHFQTTHPHHVYPYMSSSGYPIFQAITANQLSVQGLPILNNNQQEAASCHFEAAAYRPPDFSYDSLSSYSMQANHISASTSHNNPQAGKGQDWINLWHGWTRTAAGQGSNAIDGSTTFSSSTTSAEQRSVNPETTIQVSPQFMDIRTDLHPSRLSQNRQITYERERVNSNLPSSRITSFRSLIEEAGTLDEVLDSDSHSP